MPSSAIRVLSPSAVHSSLEDIVAAFRKGGGEDVALTFETAPRLVQRVMGGEIADVLVAPPKVMDELVGLGKVNPDGRFQFARAGVGVMVRAGAYVPDVSTTEALKRELLAADLVTHTQASSGVYVARLLEKLGLAETIKNKTRSFPDAQETFTYFLQSKGRRDIGFGGIPEIKRWAGKGLQFVAPLPEDIQNYTTYHAALSRTPPDPAGAQAFLAFLGSPAAKEILARHGVA